MTKRVLIFSLSYFPKHIGGAEVAIKEITDRIDDIEFHLISNRYDSTLPKAEKFGNVFVHRIGITSREPTMTDLKKWPLNFNKGLYQFLAVWKAHQLHRVQPFDAMWAMMAHSTGVPAALMKRFHPEIKFLLNLQEGDPHDAIERRMRPLWPLFSKAFETADMVQALSKSLAEWAQRRGFKGHVEIIPNAVDYKKFSRKSTPGEKEAARLKLRKNEGDVFIVTTSRLVKKNAIDDVIRAIAKLPPHFHFAIFGEGPDEKSLRSLASELSVSGRTHFLGHLKHEEMPAMLQECDIFVRPSRSEGFGASFVEAMAAGIPVIATQEGGIADFLFDETRNPEIEATGWAVDKDAPDQIVRSIQDITEKPSARRRIVANAKKMVQEKYDWDIIASTMRKRVFGPLLGEN